MTGQIIEIISTVAANGLRFGSSIEAVLDHLGTPDEAKENYTGQLEMRYADTFYRCLGGGLVECTFADHYRFRVDDIEVLSMFNWLAGAPDMIDRAKFRISPSLGIAYDYRQPQQGSVTVFQAGYWDELLSWSR